MLLRSSDREFRPIIAPTDIASGHPVLTAEPRPWRAFTAIAALAFAVFTVWIHYEVKFVLIA